MMYTEIWGTGMKDYILALDQGTTSSRCIIFDRQGRIVSLAQKEFEQIYPKPGYVEQDPMEIWASQLSVMTEAMAKAGGPSKIHAIGITNQRETTIVWNKNTGLPVYNAIVWQCRRTADMIEKLKADGMEEKIKSVTGLVPDAYFSATKIKWILENVSGAREAAERGELLFGTVDSWLIWNLTGQKVHVTDYTNAARTMLFDIHKLEWDKELLSYFGIPECMLPEVKSSSGIYGYTSPETAGESIPVAGAAGDQQAALFGQCCFSEGDMKNTYGTGCFLLMNTGKTAVRSGHGLITTLTASTSKGSPEYALEGSVFVAGAVMQWLRDEMRMIKSAPSSEDYCNAVEDTGGVYIVPAFTGMGAPYWNPYARGMVTGISRGTKKEHFVRAAVESMAYQTYDLVEAMRRDSGGSTGRLKADGGASANNFLMQFQADLIDCEVIRPECIETTALGAAYLAGLASGFWKDKEELPGFSGNGDSFKSSITDKKRAELIKGWKRTVKSALCYANEEAPEQ